MGHPEIRFENIPFHEEVLGPNVNPIYNINAGVLDPKGRLFPWWNRKVVVNITTGTALVIAGLDKNRGAFLERLEILKTIGAGSLSIVITWEDDTTTTLTTVTTTIRTLWLNLFVKSVAVTHTAGTGGEVALFGSW